MSNEKGIVVSQTAATWRRVRLSPLVMPWSALPTELIVRILEDLDPYAILNCRRVMSSTIFLCWGTPVTAAHGGLGAGVPQQSLPFLLTKN